jgi:hypothetical protein
MFYSPNDMLGLKKKSIDRSKNILRTSNDINIICVVEILL